MTSTTTASKHTPITTRNTATSAIRPGPTPEIIRIDKPADCSPQRPGYGPAPEGVDNIWHFYESPAIHSIVKAAQIPSGYIQAFGLEEASYLGSDYLGHYELESYDPLNCSMRCDEYGQIGGQPGGQKESCRGINIYFERSPSLHLGPECRDAPSRNVIKCALWGEKLHAKYAKNRGFSNWDFEVIIAGSNGYNKGVLMEENRTSAGAKKTVFGGSLMEMGAAVLLVWCLMLGMTGAL
ncbi:hypothetical protein EJ02DRAFT_344380 [Clathrospora elynae]|uniref:Uncharacterized protein n=1 Tax=Clathrospora elynae TaxID=706981 RepID=A0A6A5SS84_9PLEO|nr:hypothetical protein EJ02DRAFT_344380 [Clathrospora elynae]